MEIFFFRLSSFAQAPGAGILSLVPINSITPIGGFVNLFLMLRIATQYAKATVYTGKGGLPVLKSSKRRSSGDWFFVPVVLDPGLRS